MIYVAQTISSEHLFWTQRQRTKRTGIKSVYFSFNYIFRLCRKTEIILGQFFSSRQIMLLNIFSAVCDTQITKDKEHRYAMKTLTAKFICCINSFIEKRTFQPRQTGCKCGEYQFSSGARETGNPYWQHTLGIEGIIAEVKCCSTFPSVFERFMKNQRAIIYIYSLYIRYLE